MDKSKEIHFKPLVFDLEANSLLESGIDYTSLPYKLKPTFKVHCLAVKDLDTNEIYAFYDGDTEYIFNGQRYEESDDKYTYVLEAYQPITYTRMYIKDFPEFIKKHKHIRYIGQNSINFDMLVCRLYFGMDYDLDPETLCGEECIIEDTMILSKVLNPDRFGGHSLENLAKLSGKTEKVDFRKNVPIEDRFNTFAADMLYYNIFDAITTAQSFNYLSKEKEGWDWEDAYKLEKQVAHIITIQSHRGFKFDKELAVNCVNELDSFIDKAKSTIEPILPAKPIGKTEAKEYILNASQFAKGTGEMTKHLQKFIAKHNGEMIDDRTVKFYGREWHLPLQKDTPIKTHVKASISDTTHIKKWLVQDLGWVPLEWKDRDLTKRTTKAGKVKRTWEEFEKAVDAYVVETMNSPFCDFRLDHLKCSRNTLRSKLLDKGVHRSLKVLTNPSFTVGLEKETCPNLIAILDKFPHIEELIKYLTYRHRRNSILGGDFDPEFLDSEDDMDEPEKGYLPSVREDGRIATPAGTCDASTSRMRHKVVCNVPRVSSLYGKQMRSLFGVDIEQSVQIGYDFDSLSYGECKTY